MTRIVEERFILCLDTNQYAGNFERECTAFCTGVLGECEVGRSQAADFVEDEGHTAFISALQKKILQVEDEGCARPCRVFPTPGWVNNGLGGFRRGNLTDEVTPEDIEVHRATFREYRSRYLGCLTKEDEEAIIAASQQQWYEQYNSVGIYFSEQPTQEEIDFILKRARKFFKIKPEFGLKANLEGARLLRHTTQVIQETVARLGLKTLS